MATSTRGRATTDPIKLFLEQQGFTGKVEKLLLDACSEHGYTLKRQDGSEFIDADGLLTEASYKALKGHALVQSVADLPDSTLYPAELTAMLFAKMPGAGGEAERAGLDLFQLEAWKQAGALVRGTCGKWGGVQDRAEADDLTLVSVRVRKANGPSGQAYYLTKDEHLVERDWLTPADAKATRAEEARAMAYVLVGRRLPELSDKIAKRHAAMQKDSADAGRRLLAGELGTGSSNGA